MNSRSSHSPAPPSDRSFGFLFSTILTALGSHGFYKGWGVDASVGLICAGAALLLAAIISPSSLRPLNLAWFRLGQLLGRITSPIVLGVIFFGLLTPIAFVCRRLGRDQLRLRRAASGSYWIDREPPGPDGSSFKNQF